MSVITAQERLVKSPDAIVNKFFKFTRGTDQDDLADTEILVSVVGATATITRLKSSIPAGANDLALVGAPSIVDSLFVAVTLEKGIADQDYKVDGTVTTSANQTLPFCGIIRVRAC